MNRSGLLFAGTVVSFLALVQLLAFPNALAYRSLETMHASNISYNFADPQQSEYEYVGKADLAPEPTMRFDPQTGAIANARVRDFKISMTLNADSLAGFPNAFQTAPENLGLRLEFAPTLVGLVLASTAPGGFDFIPITRDFRLGVPHSFELLVNRDNHVFVSLDGIVRVDAVYPDLSYKINDVVVGAGLSKGRRFNGRISNASVSYGIYDTIPNADSLTLDFEAILLSIAVTCSYLLLGPEARLKLRWPWFAAPPWRRTATPRLGFSTTFPDDAEQRYAWPLPDGGKGELLLGRRQPTYRSLESLALQLRGLAGSAFPRRDGAIFEYSCELNDGIRALVRIVPARRVTREAVNRLAQYIREFADFLDE